LALLVAAPGCSPGEQTTAAAGPAGDWFVEHQAAAGLDFVHVHGGSGKRYMAETMGSGGGFLDYDGDGWLDVYLVQATALPGFEPERPLVNRLYRNRGDGTFEDVTEGSGAGDPGYGMGTCFGDVDNDGDLDIYVSNFGPDVLLRNAGDGTFEDATTSAGIDNPDWGASCAFADYDRDGCLDVYVVNYVNFTLDNHKPCGTAGLRMYCHPDTYRGAADRLYRNRCDGTFEDATEAAGVRNVDPTQSKGLGVRWVDFDGDGNVDLYVTNDSTRNFLYANNGDGTFTDVGVLSGTAYNEMGLTEAGMGIDAGDVDGDGRFDFMVTNLDFETNTLYRNRGEGNFLDATTMAGISGPSTTRVGFGTNLFDADNDGDLDLFVANGHIIDNIAESNPSLAYAQPNQLFENMGEGRFVEVTSRAGAAFSTARVSRGSAVGDPDNDGDLDLLITNCNQEVVLLRNESGGGTHWIQLRLESRHGGRDAIGAVARLTADGLTQVRDVHSGGSYLAQGDLRLHFGLGPHATIEALEILWPDGEGQSVDAGRLRVNAVNVVRQTARGAVVQ
jgi:hypothetical protein